MDGIAVVANMQEAVMVLVVEKELVMMESTAVAETVE